MPTPRDWKNEKGPAGLVDDDALIDMEERLQRWLSARDYGAKGDGETTAENIAFQAAHDALPASGGVIFVPSGEYLFAGTVKCTKPTLWIFDRGATVRRTTGDLMFSFAGGVIGNSNLTENATKGVAVLKVPTSGVSGGSYLNLRSNKSTGAPSGSTYGEIIRVKSVDSGSQLTTEAPIADSYATADTARCSLLTLLDRCGIVGGRFTQSEALTTDVTKGYIDFLYTRGARVMDAIFEKQEQFAVQFDASIDWRVERPVLRDMTYNGSTYNGYGILARGPSQGGEIRGAVGESAQIFNTGGTTRGIPRHCRVQGKATGHAATAGKSPFSLHSDSECMTIEAEVDGWGDIGIQVKGRDHVLIRPVVQRTKGVGIYLVSDSATVYPERIRIIEPHVVDVDQVPEGNVGIGIAVQGTDHLIEGAYVADTDANGINVNRLSTEPCSGTVIRRPTVRNYSRGNSNVYNAIRLGPTGVTNIVVDHPYALKAPDGARAYRFEGGEAANTGCRLVTPEAESGLTVYGESEWFAVRGVVQKSQVLTAAAELKVDPGATYIEVTGNTEITSIKKTYAGHIIVLNFTGTPTVKDGSNLKLGANFVATPDDALALICGGNNWYQMAPGSAN